MHKNLKIEHGSFDEEIVEQKMSLDFITNTDRVLELGGNIGRNSLIISSILDNSNQLVVLESDKDAAKILESNRDMNNFKFTIVNKALSKHRLCQIVWNTYKLNESEPILPGSFEVETIDYSTLISITNIKFNVLVCDCEGCLYNILIEEPSFLDNFEKVLLENDFWDHPEQEKFVHERLRDLGFQIKFKADLDFYLPRPDFWQAWIR
jgi:FkbM family methyltransferase